MPTARGAGATKKAPAWPTLNRALFARSNQEPADTLKARLEFERALAQWRKGEIESTTLATLRQAYQSLEARDRAGRTANVPKAQPTVSGRSPTAAVVRKQDMERGPRLRTSSW